MASHTEVSYAIAANTAIAVGFCVANIGKVVIVSQLFMSASHEDRSILGRENMAALAALAEGSHSFLLLLLLLLLRPRDDKKLLTDNG